MLGLGIFYGHFLKMPSGVIGPIRQKDLRTETLPTRFVAAPRVKNAAFQPMPRGVANGGCAAHHDLLVTFARSPWRRPAGHRRQRARLVIMIHDLVYLGFGIFALLPRSRVRLDRLVRPPC